MLRIANEKLKKSEIKNIDFQIQDSYKLSFDDNSFDIVIASNLLHLLYEPEKPVKEIKRVLKENGIFIVPTLCVGENAKSKMIAKIIGFISGFNVVNKWSYNDFMTILTNSGFIIQKSIKIKGKLLTAYVVVKK
jgi:ubiquinone/menaquinone biosynthesis C-methylase UbiE